MVKLFDNYVIDADESCYTFGEMKIRNDPKTGKAVPQIVPHGYFGTFRSALDGAFRYFQQIQIQKYDGDLRGAVSKIAELEKRMEKILTDNVPDTVTRPV